ncbi:MAG: N-acetyltransferase [Variovorax sp.]|nr:MAG: N-acetyltransferase [Variovorax sp.]
MQEIHRTPGDPADAGQPRLEDWEVRPAQWRELPDVAAVVAAALETFRGAVPDHVLDLYIEDSRALARQWSDGEVLAGVSAGRIVGTAVYYSGAEKQGPRTASVRTLMVHPQARKRGFGRALMAYCFSTLRSAMSMSLPTDAMFDCDRPGRADGRVDCEFAWRCRRACRRRRRPYSHDKFSLPSGAPARRDALG